MAAMEARLEEATAGMVEEAAPLWQAMARDSGNPDPDVQAWIQDERVLLESGRGTLVLARAGDDAVIGYADGVIAYDPASRETLGIGRTIYVLPEWRGEGVGERVVRLLTQVGIQRGVTKLLTHGEITKRVYEKVFERPTTDEFTFRSLRV